MTYVSIRRDVSAGAEREGRISRGVCYQRVYQAEASEADRASLDDEICGRGP